MFPENLQYFSFSNLHYASWGHFFHLFPHLLQKLQRTRKWRGDFAGKKEGFNFSLGRRMGNLDHFLGGGGQGIDQFGTFREEK